MRLGVCCTDALGWRSVRKRWSECLPLAFEAVAEFPPEEFGFPNLKLGLRTLAKTLATRLAVAEALRAGCDRVLVATNGEATLLPSRWASRLAIYGDASHRQLDALYGFGRPERKNRARDRACQRLAAGGARFLAMSSWCAEGFAGDYGAQPVVLAPPVDTRVYSPAATPGAGVLFVGGDFERKGGPRAAEAAQAMPHIPFTFVTLWRGRVPPNVVLAGPFAPDGPELIDAYQSASIFALPTLADCYSHVIAEAQACGLPVVACVTGGIGDLVRDGVEGIVVPPADAQALVGAIERLASDDGLRRRMGMAGRQRAVAEQEYAVHAARARAAIE
jgi:glycosyltransferase involved in cell wall biosynthesis